MIVLPSVSSGVISSSFFDPKKISGLALWLKADTGVSTSSFNYISQIIITGTSNPSFAGTYTATTVPTYNGEYGYVGSYLLMGPEGKSMSWDGDEFILGSSGEPSDSFYSADGENWTAGESYVYQIVITGFSGIYAGANGTYNGDGNYFTRVGGEFFIDGDGLKDTDSESLIATPPANYSGSWTPASYESSVTLTGAGTTSVNGTYTRANTQVIMFSLTYNASGGREMYYDGAWYVTDSGGLQYYNDTNGERIIWNVFEGNGTPQAPTGSVGTSLRNVGYPTSTSSSKPTGSISGSVTTATVNTDEVTAWVDQSGDGNNATPVADNPIYNISDLNSKPTISLTSMSDEIERVFTISSNPLGASGSTAFSVQYVEDVCGAGDDNGSIFGNFGASETQTHYPYGPDCLVYDAFATTSRKVELTPPTAITATWSIYSVHSTNGEWKDYVNGQLMHSDPSNTYSNSVGGDDTTLYIGKQTGSGIFSLKGKVAEVIVYNRVLTTLELQQVEAYLNSKYAIY